MVLLLEQGMIKLDVIWIMSTKATTYIGDIKKWCPQNLFLYYLMEPFTISSTLGLATKPSIKKF